MRRLVAILCVALPLWGQRHPAGTDAAGKQLTVVEKHFPARPADAKRCVPKTQYLLESAPLVTLCQTDDPVETSVEVGPNRITVNRDGGTQAGFYLHRSFQLSPWKALEADACSFMGSEKSTYEEWDFRSMKGQAWLSSSDREEGLCAKGPKLPTYLLVPAVAYEAKSLEAAHGSLGSCALKLDASGENGFVIWGKADPRDPVEVKLLWAGNQTLLAQVRDAQRNTKAASSWVNADHLEIWMGDREGDPAEMWQFGISIDEGPVQIGHGKPQKVPAVRRWTANLERGGTATALLIELPPRDAMWTGVTIAYSQSLEGRAQKRLIATSRIKRAGADSLGAEGSTLENNSAAEYVTCGLVKGALEITGGPKTPLYVPAPEGR